jgi:hypothetical protein
MRVGIRVARGLWIGLYPPRRPPHRCRRRVPCRCKVHRHRLLRWTFGVIVTIIVLYALLAYALFMFGRYVWRRHHARHQLPQH